MATQLTNTIVSPTVDPDPNVAAPLGARQWVTPADTESSDGGSYRLQAKVDAGSATVQLWWLTGSQGWLKLGGSFALGTSMLGMTIIPSRTPAPSSAERVFLQVTATSGVGTITATYTEDIALRGPDGAGALPLRAYSNRIPTNVAGRMVYAGSGAPVIVADAYTARVPGVHFEQLYPAGTASGWSFGDPLVPDVGFDATKDCYALLDVLADGAVIITTRKKTPASAAPTISSVVVANATPTLATLTWSAAVDWIDLTGMSLSFSAGTPRTILSATGEDSTSTVLTLSGALSPGDAATLRLAAGHNFQGTNGVAVVAPATVAVTNNVVAGPLSFTPTPILLLETPTGLTTSAGPKVNTWTDQAHGGVYSNGTYAPAVVLVDAAMNNQPTIQCRISGTTILDGGTNLDLSAYNQVTIYMLCRTYSTSPQLFAEFGPIFTTAGCWTLGYHIASTGVAFYATGNVGASEVDYTTVASGGPHIVKGVWDITLATNETSMLVDGAGPAGVSRAANSNNTGNLGNQKLHIAGRAGSPPVDPSDIDLWAVCIVPGLCDATYDTAIRNWWRGLFGAAVP